LSEGRLTVAYSLTFNIAGYVCYRLVRRWIVLKESLYNVRAFFVSDGGGGTAVLSGGSI